jgi:hypothetical protein
MRKQTLGIFVLVLALIVTVSSCKKDGIDPVKSNPVASYDAEAALKWNLHFLNVERYAAGYRPGPAPRALAYLGLATYEACVPGMPSYNSLAHRYAGLSVPPLLYDEVHWPTVVHAIYENMIPKFFPNPPAHVQTEMQNLILSLNTKYLAEAGAAVFNNSRAYGNAVAEAVWAWSATDAAGHDAYKDPFGSYDPFAVYKKPGDWLPTTPGPQQPMYPEWGKARTFAISQDQKVSKPPIPYSESPSSEFYSQALEVYAQNTPTLPYNVKWIGEFWSDDLLNLTFSPGPRWMAIANQVIEKEGSSLETAIEAYTKVGMALNDAAVACWHSKYLYNVERPETYIQRLIDPNWDCNLNNPITGDQGFTPPFPAYPSGHSTMGAAGAEALASVFGYAYSMTDRCHEFRNEFIGVPRTFGSFYEMAQENAWSRVLLGVHFRMDCDEGVRHGTVIAREVNRLPWK